MTLVDEMTHTFDPAQSRATLSSSLFLSARFARLVLYDQRDLSTD